MDIDPVIDPSSRQLYAFVSAIDAAGHYVSRDAAREAMSNRTIFNVVDSPSG